MYFIGDVKIGSIGFNAKSVSIAELTGDVNGQIKRRQLMQINNGYTKAMLILYN